MISHHPPFRIHTFLKNWSLGTSFQEYSSYHEIWGNHFHLLLMARFFLLMNYISLNKPPFFHLFRTKKKHLLISWLFRVVKGVILFPPRTSDPNGKRSPTFRASLTWKESYFLKRLTSWSHTFSLLGLVLCDVVLGLLCSLRWRNLQKQQQTSQGSESHSNEIWLFNTEVLVSQRISANWFLIRFFAKYWWYVENWWFPLNQDAFVNFLHMERRKNFHWKGRYSWEVENLDVSKWHWHTGT